MLGELVAQRHWAFDRVMLSGARALGAPRAEPGPFLPGPLPDAPAPLVELDDVVRFVERPVRAFLRQRLGIVVGDFNEEVEDALTVELDNLEQWGSDAGCWRDGSPARRSTTAWPPRSRAGCCRRATSGHRSSTGCSRWSSRSPCRRSRSGTPSPARPTSGCVWTTAGLLSGTVGGRSRRPPSQRHLLARRPPSPDRALRALAGAHRRRSRAGPWRPR
jgi:hypothetical protein